MVYHTKCKRCEERICSNTARIRILLESKILYSYHVSCWNEFMNSAERRPVANPKPESVYSLYRPGERFSSIKDARKHIKKQCH